MRKENEIRTKNSTLVAKLPEKLHRSYSTELALVQKDLNENFMEDAF